MLIYYINLLIILLYTNMTNTESFLRWRIGISILSTQTVPFTLPVSVVPKNDNQFITISPDTENEEIFYYTTRTWTAGQQWTIQITARWYNKNNNTTDNSNYKEHKINDVFKWALNHIIINDKSSLSENNTFNWDNIFTKSIKVPNFLTEAERDSLITNPSNWMICYIKNVEDYYNYKNWVWIKWFWWASYVEWFQNSTSNWTISWVINWVNTTFTLSNTPTQPQAVILMYNWQVLEYLEDYTITWNTITMILIPEWWKLVAKYPWI